MVIHNLLLRGSPPHLRTGRDDHGHRSSPLLGKGRGGGHGHTHLSS